MGIVDWFRPKWRHPNQHVRQAAVARLTKQHILTDIAKNDQDEWVRMAAVERVTDQSLLADIAKNARSIRARHAATERVTDESLLVDIATNSDSSAVRYAATARLTDQSILLQIAGKDDDSDVRRLAASRVTGREAAGPRVLGRQHKRRYDNAEWRFSLDFPSDWEILCTDERAGAWTIPIGVAGAVGPGGRPCFTVNAQRRELLRCGRYLTPGEYIAGMNASPVTDLPDYVYTEGDSELQICGCPAAWMPARFRGDKGPILEDTVTVFAPGRTFQLISELPVAQQETLGAILKDVRASFTLISA